MQEIPSWFLPAVLLASTAVHAILSWRHNRPSDGQRAALLGQIAQDAAAFVVAAWPNKPWAELLAEVVKRVLTLPSTPTQNTQAIENAAAAALARMGKVPSAR